MKKILNSIQQIIESDKGFHFLAGWALSSISPTWWGCLLIAFLVGTLKEVIDKYVRKKKFDLSDLLYTLSGGVIASSIHLLKLFAL